MELKIRVSAVRFHSWPSSHFTHLDVHFRPDSADRTALGSCRIDGHGSLALAGASCYSKCADRGGGSPWPLL